MRTKSGPGSAPSRSRGGGSVVEHDEVDVARIVEFARALLAEREHDHAAAGLRIRRVGIEREPAGHGVLAQDKGERCADRRVGEAGQRLRRRDDVPDAADVGERDQERRLALGVAQRTASARPRRRRAAL